MPASTVRTGPMASLDEAEAVPITSRVSPGALVPIPNLWVDSSMKRALSQLGVRTSKSSLEPVLLNVLMVNVPDPAVLRVV